MKRLIALAVVTVWAIGAAAVFAGGDKAGCCMSGKDGKADPFSKLSLTPDQQTKIAALKKECDAVKCSEGAKSKFMDGVKGILTADQFKQLQAECSKAGCPMKKADATAEKKS